MKRLFIIFFITFFNSHYFYAQPNIQWQKSLGGPFGETSKAISNTSDGGFITVGKVQSNGGDVTGYHGGIFDAWIVKLDSSRNIQWQRCLGGTHDDGAYSVIQTADGGYIIAGYTASDDGDVQGHHGTTFKYDSWIIKLTSTGTIQWQKCLGGTEEDVAYSVIETADSGYVAVGYTNSDDGDVIGFHGSTANCDSWIVKLTSSGFIQWQKCLGGASFDVAYSISNTLDYGFIIGGNTNSNDGDVSGNHGGGSDAWIVKLDSSRNIQWQSCIGGSLLERAYSISITSDGGYVFTGITVSNDGDVTGNHGGYSDSWIVKLDSLGSKQWQRCLGGTGEDAGNCVQQTADGSYIVAGYTASDDSDVIGHHGITGGHFYDSWIVSLSSTGSIQWQKCLGGSLDDGANSILESTDGGIVVAGYSNSSDGDVTGAYGQSDVWILKLNSFVNIFEIENVISNIQASPNPFSNETKLTFQLLNHDKIKIEIYDAMAQLIKSFSSVNFQIGTNEILWDGTDTEGRKVHDGLYFMNFVSNQTMTKKIVFIGD